MIDNRFDAVTGHISVLLGIEAGDLCPPSYWEMWGDGALRIFWTFSKDHHISRSYWIAISERGAVTFHAKGPHDKWERVRGRDRWLYELSTCHDSDGWQLYDALDDRSRLRELLRWFGSKAVRRWYLL